MVKDAVGNQTRFTMSLVFGREGVVIESNDQLEAKVTLILRIKG